MSVNRNSDSDVLFEQGLGSATGTKDASEVTALNLVESKTRVGCARGQGETVVDLTCSDDDEDVSKIFSDDSTSRKHQTGRHRDSSSCNEDLKGGSHLPKGRGGSVTKKGSKSAPKGTESSKEGLGSWICSSCTYANPAAVKFCDICLLPLSKSIAKIALIRPSDDCLLDFIDDKKADIKAKVEVKGEMKTEMETETACDVTLDLSLASAASKINTAAHCVEGYHAPCGVTRKRKATDVEGSGSLHEDAVVEMSESLPEPLPIGPNTVPAASYDLTDRPTDGDSQADFFPLSVSASAAAASASAAAGSLGVTARFHAFGYRYPEESLEHTDLILLKLVHGRCVEGVDATPSGTARGATAEGKCSPATSREAEAEAEAEAAVSNSSSGRRSSRIRNNESSCRNSINEIESSSYSGDSGSSSSSSSSSSSEDYTALSHSLWQWVPPSCEVFGKRYGDPKRKGKSRFCGTCTCTCTCTCTSTHINSKTCSHIGMHLPVNLFRHFQRG